MAGTIIADTIQATSQQISLNVGNTTILTASSTGLTLIPSNNVNINITNSSIASLSFGSGNVTRPSISFSGNTSTGMYMPLADTIAFTTAGTEDMRLDSGGNVSIGATSTVGKLNVTGNDNAHLYLKQNNTDNGWLMATSSADGVFRLQRRGEGGSPTNNERFSVQPDGQMFHNATYLLGSSYNAYYGKNTTGSTIVSGYNDTGLSVASVYIPTNVRKVLLWFHVSLRWSSGITINHTAFRCRVVRASDSNVTYVGDNSWGFGISQGINTTPGQNWTVCSQFVNLYDYDTNGNQAGLTAGQTYTFYLQASDAYATGSQLKIGAEANGAHQPYTPQHAMIWIL